jgi:DHA3 family macrolide efflux protein-like MFS transporter
MMVNRRTLRVFYILILTQTFSLIGSRMTGLAVAIKVFKDTDRATPLALTAFFSTLPSLVSASLAGVLADRWDRRYVMVIADAGQAVGTLLLMISFLSGAFQLWHLYVVVLIQSVFGIFQGPAFQASVTMLVPDEHRDRANAIQQLTGPMSGVVAPILAGLLFAEIGAAGVMGIDLFTFAVAVIVVLLVSIPRPEQTAEGRAMQGSIWKEAAVGFRYLASRRILFAISLFSALVNFLLSAAMVLDTPYILTITGSEAALGTLMGVMSAGGIVGGVIMSVWGGTRPRIHTIMPGIIAAGVFLALFGISRSPVTMGIVLFWLLVPIPMINAAFMSIMQLKVPPDLQGRVFAALGQLSMLLMPLAYLVAGPLADKVFEPAVGRAGWGVVAPLVGSHAGSGIGLIMLVSGSLLALVSVIAYAVPAFRHMEATLPDYLPVAATPSEDEAAEVPTAATPAAA